MKKALFLYSDLTGVSFKKRRIPKAIARLGKIFDLTVCKTSTLEELEEKVLLVCSSFDVLIAVGGDGTFHRVINVVAKAARKPILGFINAGTMGDVASNFGSSHSFWKGVKIIENGYTSPMDLCSVNDIYFAYMGAVGAYSDVAYKAKRGSKKRLGKFVYYFLSLGEVFQRRRLDLTLTYGEEQTHFDGPFLLLMNGRRVGGFYVNRKGEASDGKFEVYMTPKGMFNGLLHYLLPKKKWRLSVSELRIESKEELPWCFDGEKYVFSTLNIKSCHSKISVFCREKRK